MGPPDEGLDEDLALMVQWQRLDLREREVRTQLAAVEQEEAALAA
jgi:hypothetical protein